MSEEKVTEAVIPQVEKAAKDVKEEKPIHHEIGDLTLKCGKCGNIETLQENIPGGISFILGTIEKAEVKMKCGECDNEISLYFAGMTDERDVEFKKEKEIMEEALKQEQAVAEKAEVEAVLADEKTVNIEVGDDGEETVVDAEVIEETAREVEVTEETVEAIAEVSTEEAAAEIEA